MFRFELGAARTAAWALITGDAPSQATNHMTQPHLSNATNGAEHSAFQSTQSALARKPLPGPEWAWPGVAALAVAAIAYLVAGTSGEHAAHSPPPSAPAESPPAEAASPTTTTTVAALQPPAPAPAAAPTNPPAPAPADVAAPAPKPEAEPTKARDDSEHAVASSSALTKKKLRGAAHRSIKKRSAPAH